MIFQTKVWLRLIIVSFILMMSIFLCIYVIHRVNNISSFMKCLLLIYIISILWLAFQRNTYLPFLGECAIPIPSSHPKSTSFHYTVSSLPPHRKVIYWAAMHDRWNAESNSTPYEQYENSGITTTDENGKAIFELPYHPSSYRVSLRTLPPHIHYRYELNSNGGIWSSVFTIEVPR